MDQPEVLTCWCGACEAEYLEQFRDTNPMKYMMRKFIVCIECGNKRCPKAWFHEYMCTDSNDVGQQGTRE